MAERLRWRLARWLDDRLPDACWADLASWAMGQEGYTLRQAMAPRRLACIADIAENGGCWCGKVRASQATEPRHIGGPDGGSDGSV